MKIQKAIMSVDDNPLYSDFWFPVSKVWKLRFNIEPVLIYFGEKELDTTYGSVIETEAIEDIPLYLQTQWARFWYTTTEPETTFIISDIDMFPISHKYFINQLENIDENKYVHLYGNHRPLPVCYHVAKGKQFKKILNLEDSFEASMRTLYSFEARTPTHMGFDKWGLEEAYSTKIIENSEHKDDLIFLSRRGERIDRSNWTYNPELLKKEDYYIDSHSVRPYEEYKLEIENLVELLVSIEK